MQEIGPHECDIEDKAGGHPTSEQTANRLASRLQAREDDRETEHEQANHLDKGTTAKVP